MTTFWKIHPNKWTKKPPWARKYYGKLFKFALKIETKNNLFQDS
jgi:hypothetical protein